MINEITIMKNGKIDIFSVNIFVEMLAVLHLQWHLILLMEILTYSTKLLSHRFLT